MEALKFTGKALEGKLTVAVPDEYNGKSLEISIIVAEDDGIESVELTEDLKQKRMEDFGKAPFPHFPTNKYDVYNQ